MKSISRLLHVTIMASILFVPAAAFAATDYSWCVTGPALTPSPSGNPTTYAVVTQVCSETPSCCDTSHGRWGVTCVQEGSNYAITNGLGDICGGGAWAEAPISGSQEYYPRDFNLVALTGNVTLIQSVADPVATAGTFTLSGFSMDYRNEPIALVAQGNVSLQGGTIGGAVDYSAGYTANSVQFVDASPPTGPVTSPINFTTADSRLLAMSAALAGYPANGTVKIQYGGVTFTGTDPDLNVFSISASSITNATNYTYSVPSGSHVIVNVSGTSAIVENAGISGGTASNILWNFPNATTLTLSSISFPGSILAPSATATLSSGQLSGTVVVASAYRLHEPRSRREAPDAADSGA
jgi:choice-of-anchor A domain-containing protein